MACAICGNPKEFASFKNDPNYKMCVVCYLSLVGDGKAMESYVDYLKTNPENKIPFSNWKTDVYRGKAAIK